MPSPERKASLTSVRNWGARPAEVTASTRPRTRTPRAGFGGLRRGGVAADELEVPGDQAHEPEEGEEGSGHRHARRAEPEVLEDAHRQQRVGVALLPPHEDRADGPGDGEAGECPHIGPPVDGRLDDGDDEGRDGGDRQQETDDVEPGCGLVAGLGDEVHRRRDGDDDDGNVDVEHRPPPEVLQEPAAHDGPGGDSDAAHCVPHSDRLGPLRRNGEDVRDDRECGGEDRGGTDPHERSRRDQLPRTPDRAGVGGGDAEHRQPGDEDPLAAVAVAQCSGRQEQPGEHEEVRVDDPLQLADRGSGRTLHRTDAPRHRRPQSLTRLVADAACAEIGVELQGRVREGGGSGWWGLPHRGDGGWSGGARNAASVRWNRTRATAPTPK